MSKNERYESLFKQIKSITSSESNKLANLVNTIALIHHEFNFWWTGIYFVENDELILGPFQGPVACTRIPKGKGVCGSSFEKKESIVVKMFINFQDILPVVQNLILKLLYHY